MLKTYSYYYKATTKDTCIYHKTLRNKEHQNKGQQVDWTGTGGRQEDDEGDWWLPEKASCKWGGRAACDPDWRLLYRSEEKHRGGETDERGGRNNKNNNKMENTKNIMGLMGKNQTWSVRTKNERYKEEEQWWCHGNVEHSRGCWVTGGRVLSHKTLAS